MKVYLYFCFYGLLLYVPDVYSLPTPECNDDVALVKYHCHNSTQCVSRRNEYCDGEKHCSDGTDEILYNATLHTKLDGVACKSKYIYNRMRQNPTIDPRDIEDSLTTCLLPARYVCDDEVDCINGIDECGCDNTFRCGPDECLLKQMFCDGKVDCVTSNVDEMPYNSTLKAGFQCPVTITHITNTCQLDLDYVCDGFSDCDDGVDECFCDFTKGVGRDAQIHAHSNDRCFKCLDGLKVLPKRHVCDGIVHCADASDECLCMNPNQTISQLCDNICPGPGCTAPCEPDEIFCVPMDRESTNIMDFCHPASVRCNNVYECADGSDEIFCPQDDQVAICDDGMTLIKKHYWCDHKYDCPDQSDETRCNNEKYFCDQYNGFFRDYDITNPDARDNVTRDLPPVGYRNRNNREIIFMFDNPFYADACDGVPTCTGLDDECEFKYDICPGRTENPGYCKYVNDTVFTCPNTKSKLIGVEICDGKPTCNVTSPWDSADELHCPNRFYCNDRGRVRLPIHVSLKERCNNLADCFDQSDELNCSKDTHFYCNDGGDVSFVQRSQVCNGNADCKSGIDECQLCQKSPFSSDEWMINNKFFKFMLWLMGLIATCGNIYVIIITAHTIFQTNTKLNKVTYSNRVFVINLALSDLLVGLYLVSLGIKDAQFTGKYCLMDEEWRSSATCAALGSMAMLGTETSVIILTIMTSYRVYLVSKPFQKQKTRLIAMLAVLAWLIGAVLAFMPLSPYLKEYFQAEICASEHTWDQMISINQMLNQSYVPTRFYGFYAAHGVCLPRLFPDQSNDSFGYSLFIVLFNLCAFVYIMGAYIYIYTKTTKKGIHSTGSESRAQTLQKKVTRIVLTNFCCWIPICVMALINVSGVKLPDLAYVVSAIILMPINSAFNPFLYTDLPDLLWKFLQPVVGRCSTFSPANDTTTGNQRMSTLTGNGQQLTPSGNGQNTLNRESKLTVISPFSSNKRSFRKSSIQITNE